MMQNSPLAIFGTLQYPELIIILLIAVFLFGAKKIPDLARSVGRGLREFRKGLYEDIAAPLPTSNPASEPKQDSAEGGGNAQPKTDKPSSPNGKE